MESDQVHSSGDRQYVTAKGFTDQMECATPTSVCHPSSQESDKKHDVPEESHSQQCTSLTLEASKKLDDAPSIRSLPSLSASRQSIVQDQMENVAVSLSGSSTLSTAQAMLCQSLDSGSLTGAVRGHKDEQNQINMPSNVSSDGLVNNIIGSSVGTVTSNTSSEDNTKQVVSLPKSSRGNSPPASSYLEMTTRSNLEERLADFDTINSSSQKKFGIPMRLPSNDLDRSIGNTSRDAGAVAGALPKNITNQKQSLSINEDWSLTSPKSVTKSTQTEPSTDQEQDSFGGAASAVSLVQTMSSGPSSSLPSDDVLVRKLKRPIIQWLQRKLETNVGMAWQDLVDLHDWDYERITDFESSCTGKSPFCMLLTEPEFQMYRMSDLKKDLEKLPRKDILHDLDDFMRRHYK